jgi:signal transduction histidine kinase
MVELVDYSYREEKFDIKTVITDTIKIYKSKISKKNLSIHIEKKTTQSKNYLDKKHFYLCFSNIFSNAIKYSKKG